MSAAISMRNSSRIPRRQRGAALVVGLVLLVILTLLAVSGMNTASVELVMTGNEQYRQQAFQAGATGIERALTKLATVPQTSTPQTLEDQVIAGTSDKYTISSQYLGDDLDLPGFSSGKFVGFHYEVTSKGTSGRGAQSQQLQGAFVIQNAGSVEEFSSIAPPPPPAATP
jgi:type IV pilus assembly protein PilX